MAFTQITITGNYQLADGTPVDGTVTFTPTVAMRNGSGTSETTVSGSVVAGITAGVLSTSLAATDDADTTPAGVTYKVEERINRQAGVRTYYLPVPHDAGTLDLDTATIAETIPGAITIPVPGPEGPEGPQGEQGPQGPAGADGAGAVDSVNGQIGAVDLGLVDLTDVDGTAAQVGGVVTATQVDVSGNATAFGTGPRLTAARLAMEPARRGFELALTERAERKLIGVYIGASTVEGSVADWDRKLSVLLEKMFQRSYNPPGIPGGYTTKARDAGAWTTTGTTGETQDIDLKKVRTLTAGATLTHTTRHPATGLQIQYLEGTGQGAFTVEVDDFAPFTITPDTGLPVNSPTGVWESPVFERTVHTIRITAVGACSIGNIVIRDGDRDHGITLYNAGRAGGGTGVFLPATHPTTWQRIAALEPDFVPVQLGHNDMGSVTTEQFKTNLGLIVDAINASSPGKTVWVPMIAQQSTDSRYPAFAEALREFAATRANCSFHSYREFVGTTQAEVDASTEGLWFTDYTHLLSKGHEFAAQLLADQLGLPSRQTWEATPPAADDLSFDWETDPALLAYWDPNALAETTGATVASLPVADGSLTSAALVQATEAKKPTVAAGPNGRKAVRFVAASTQELGVTFASQTTPATVLAVWRRSGATGTRLFSGVGTDFLSFLVASGTPYTLRLDTKVAPAGITNWTDGPDQNWHIAVVVYDGASTRLYHDSRTPVTLAMSATPAAWNSMSLGRNNTGSAFADHENSGLVAFSRALSDFEVGRLFDSFAALTAIEVAS